MLRVASLIQTVQTQQTIWTLKELIAVIADIGSGKRQQIAEFHLILWRKCPTVVLRFIKLSLMGIICVDERV